MNTDVMFSSKTDQWATPQWVFDQLHEEFKFTLDPCADEFNHKCDKYFTKEQNGLSKDWGSETVFCNPPYGREIPHWVQKCFDEVHSGNCPCAVMLIPARTDTQWFHKYIYRQAEIRFVKGRLKFGDSTNCAPFPSMVVVFRKGGETNVSD
jgi:site-specific DNA-methyltransferase (adenine-specific)